MLTVSLALLIHAAITLPAILHFVARTSPMLYAKALSPALLTAFSSASSNGTLPLTMACVEERAGINNRVTSFVLPLGATINMDGTALYEAVAVLFIAQLYHGGDLSLAQQVVVGITALLGQHRRRGHSARGPGDDGDRPAGRWPADRNAGDHPGRRSRARHVPHGGQRLERRLRLCGRQSV
jgi:hypothetical protein